MFRMWHLCTKTNVEVLQIAKGRHTSENYTREESTIFWTLDTRKGKTKSTDGSQDTSVKTERKAKKDLDK